MAQSRLFFSADKAEAERVYNILEQAFEEDGFPIAITEIDEDRQVFEVSVYVEDDAEEVAGRIDELVGTGLLPSRNCRTSIGSRIRLKV